MELCSLSNSHSGADTNGKESEAQLFMLDTHEVCQEAAGDCLHVVQGRWGGRDTSFSTVEQLCLVLSWLGYTLGLWQWKQGEKITDVWPETN